MEWHGEKNKTTKNKTWVDWEIGQVNANRNIFYY